MIVLSVGDEVTTETRADKMRKTIKKSSRKIYRWIRHPRHRKRSKFRNWLAERVFDRRMWTHPSAHTFAGGLAVGLSIGMVIVPMQMFIAAFVCCWFRFHVPVAVAAVWISNPLTWAPCAWIQDKIGEWFLRLAQFDVSKVEYLTVEMFGLSLNGAYVYTGAALCAIGAGLLGYPAGLYFGQKLVTRRERRRQEQLEEARLRAAEKSVSDS